MVVTQGTCGNIWSHFWLSQLGDGCCYNLAGTVKGCPYSNAQNSPPSQQRIIQHRMLVLNLRNPDYSVSIINKSKISESVK
jgi:hypothetical protein